MKKKSILFAIISVVCLSAAGCGTDNSKYITDESISQFKLASVSAFTQAQMQIETIGSDFKIGNLPEGDVRVCEKPVPRALIKVLGQDLAVDLKLAVCLAEGRKLDIKLEKDSELAQLIGVMDVTYDLNSIMYDVSCLEALKLGDKDWRKKLPFRKGVPTEKIEQAELGAATEKLLRIESDFSANLDRIVSNLKQSGGDLEIVYGLQSAGVEFKDYLATYDKQPDGPVMTYPEFDKIISDNIGTAYEKLFETELKLEK
jgi:hypothetical protein